MTAAQKILLIVIFLSGWLALITQLYLNLQSGVAPPGEIIIRYFSYFTLDTNLFVVLCATFLLFKPKSVLTTFFSKQSTQTAAAVYIFIVGLIYNTILRFIWQPQGINMIVDELLHLVNPVLFIIYWLLYSNKKVLTWKAVLPWLIYPFVYLFFVIIRSPWSGFYPYPFLNIKQLSLNTVLINCVGITSLFIITSLIFIRMGNYLAKKKFSQAM